MIKRTRVRSWAAICGLLLGSPLPAQTFDVPSQGWRPEPPMVKTIEEHVTMPMAAGALTEYQRFYSGIIDSGRKVVWGVMVADSIAVMLYHKNPLSSIDGMPKVYIVDAADIPIVIDAGCGVVWVRYDVEKDVISAHCSASPPPVERQ